MARSYHVDIAAVVAGAEIKWVDNLLSHFSVAGVESAKQGIARRLSIEAIRTVLLARSLSRELGLPLDRAIRVAEQLLEARGDAVPVGGWTELRFDRSAFLHEVDRRVEEATESVAPRRRGRPPARPAGK